MKSKEEHDLIEQYKLNIEEYLKNKKSPEPSEQPLVVHDKFRLWLVTESDQMNKIPSDLRIILDSSDDAQIKLIEFLSFPNL